MRKKCRNCGKEFEAKDPRHDLCPQCFTSSKEGKDLLEDLFLKSYFDKNKNFVRDVFLDIPELIAEKFSKSKLTAKQLRDFFLKIKKARNIGFSKGMEKAKPLLWECSRDLEYQLGRGSIPETFYRFMKHHLFIAEKDIDSLNGFCEHLESVLAFFTKMKGGEA